MVSETCIGGFFVGRHMIFAGAWPVVMSFLLLESVIILFIINKDLKDQQCALDFLSRIFFMVSFIPSCFYQSSQLGNV